jgi:hypothetical protein
LPSLSESPCTSNSPVASQVPFLSRRGHIHDYRRADWLYFESVLFSVDERIFVDLAKMHFKLIECSIHYLITYNWKEGVFYNRD